MRQFAVLLKRLGIAACIGVFALTADTAIARLLGPPAPFDVMVNNTDLIVHATITSATPQFVEGFECGTRYTATIVTTFKQNSAEQTERKIAFGRASGLQVGESYVLFLYRMSDTDIYQNRLVNRPEPKELLMRLVRCNGLAPGLEFDTSIWKVVDEKIEIAGTTPSSWPNAVPMHRKIEPPVAVVSREHLFSYLKTWTPDRIDPQYRDLTR